MSSHTHDVQSSSIEDAHTQSGALYGATLEEPQTEARSDSHAMSLLLDVLRRVYVGRSFFGGLIAIELAWVAQNALIWGNDPVVATCYYIAATLLLLLSLSHPSLSFLRRRATLRISTTSDAAPTTNQRSPAASDLTDAQVRSAAIPAALPNGQNSTLPTRLVRPHAAPVSQSGSADSRTPGQTLRMRIRSVSTLWVRWRALRDRLGWRIAAPLAALTVALIVATVVALLGEVTSPLGGWLWAASIISLILTSAVAPIWPLGKGLVPDARSDFFGRGVPILTSRWETAVIMFILAVSLVLRLINLEYHPGIFGDEGERGMEARAILEGRPTFIFGSGWWGVPNFYFYLVSFFLGILGDHNMVADRMLSVMSGIIAVGFVFRTGKLLWGQRAGLIAAAILAVSPLALQFSRLAGESTPTGTLWAIGFFYLMMALRFRKWSDWALSGFFWGFSLYFYAAGKLIIPLIAVLGLYCLVRWRLDFFKRYALGFALLGVIFILTGLPYGIYSAKQNWLNFTGRANETSIFSPVNQPATFARFGLGYPRSDPGAESTVQSMLSHPLAWTQLLYHQVRETTDVLYRRPDQVVFYRHGEHGGTMFPPFWAGIVMLSLIYATWKFWDGRFALVSLWFWFGMLGSVLTVDAPNLQRITGAWPALMLLPAALLDRVFAGAWPLSLNLARKWATVPIAASLLWLGADSYREYFVSYASTCPYCVSTVQARYVEALGQDYTAYQMGVGGYDVYVNYGSTRFVAKGVEGVDVLAAPDYLPATTTKGAAFLIYPNNYEYLPIIRLMYPGGKEEVMKGVDGSEIFTSYKLTRDQLNSFRTVQASYAPSGNASPVIRDEPHLGTNPAGGLPPPQWLLYPVRASWKAGVIAPEYGVYVFSITGSATDAKLEIDGRILQTGLSDATQPVEIVLAKGLHQVTVSGVLSDPQGKLEVRWSRVGSAPTLIDRRYLYNGPNGGLSAEIAPLPPDLDIGALSSSDPALSQVRTTRRSDSFVGYRVANVAFGDESYFARWQGQIEAEVEGTYRFSLTPGAMTLLLIDGAPVIGSGASGHGQVHLTRGQHTVDLRYVSARGPARIEWTWTPPGGRTTLVPPTVLSPARRSWLPAELPDPPAGQPLPPLEGIFTERLEPTLVSGEGLPKPR